MKGADGAAMGGHLVEAHMRPTLEVMPVESPERLRRKRDPNTIVAATGGAVYRSADAGESWQKLPLEWPASAAEAAIEALAVVRDSPIAPDNMLEDLPQGRRCRRRPSGGDVKRLNERTGGP